MKIYRAVKRNLITQSFGQNKYDIYKQWGMLGHNGIDWSCENGDPVYFDVDTQGTVLINEVDSNGGIGIDIITKDGAKIYKHRYWHLQKSLVNAGDKVDTGDLIAYGDNTGWSTGPHLHRALKPQTLDQYGNYKNELQNNGYKGAIDQWPYMDNIFVVDYMNALKTKISILQKIIEIIKKLIEAFKGH